MKRRIWGRNAVIEALRSNARAVAVVLYDQDDRRGELNAVLDLARKANVELAPRSRADLDQFAESARHQGVVAVSAEEYPYLDLDALVSDAPDNGLLVGLDELTDVGNVGAIVRSSVAFGAHGIVLTRHRTAPINHTVVRASAGATEHARIARVTNLVNALDALHEEGWTSVALVAEESEPLEQIDLTQRVVLVVGAEDRGVRRLVRERCTHRGHVPMTRTIGSLNASVAAGIALYEAARQRRAVNTEQKSRGKGASERT